MPVERSDRIDNFKGLLILAVVLGHALFPLLETSPAARTLYVFLYAFHMPLFAGVSGYLTRPGMSPRQARGILVDLLIPYLLLQAIYWVFLRFLVGEPLSFSPFTPYYILWYLLALAAWRLLLPVVLLLRAPLAWTVGLALVAGVVHGTGEALAAGRIVFLLPCFVAGHLLAAGRWRDVPVPGRISSVLLIGAVVAGAAWWEVRAIPINLLYGSQPYAVSGIGDAMGTALRLAQYAVAAGSSLALWRLTPAGRGPLTAMGERTIAVYVLHGFVVRTLFEVLLVPWIRNDWWLIPYLLLAAVVAWLLSTPPCVRLADALCGKPWTARLLKAER